MNIGDRVKFVKNVMEEDCTQLVVELGYKFIIAYFDDDGLIYDELENPFMEEELEYIGGNK